MKSFKACVLLLFCSLWAIDVIAQNIANYALTANTTTAYTALTTPTNPTLTSGNIDDGYFNAIPIGFDFFYMGIPYTTVSASTNGWVELGSIMTAHLNGNDLTNGSAPRPIIAPLWDDLDIAATTNVAYKTTGAAPNRVFTLQYSNVEWSYTATSAVISFQVILTESTGLVTFRYLQGASAVSGGSASIGLTAINTGSGNFLSLTNATSAPGTSTVTETTTISTKPATNQNYIFTAPTPTAPTSLSFTNVGATSMTLNWTDNASNEVAYAIYRSTDGGTTYSLYGMAPANTTSSTQAGLTGSFTYFWRVYAVTEGRLSTALSGSQTTLCPGPSLSQVPTSGLLAWYKLDGNSNDDQNSNLGIFQNGPTSTTDRFGSANKAYSFNGTSQFMATTNTYASPNDFTISVWFQTSSNTGGRLAGFGDSRISPSGNHDRMLWLDDDGKISFCVNPGGVGYTITSANNYNDGTWHQAAATSSSTLGIMLYIDGALVASNATPTGGQNYSGYWKLGWETGGWTPASTNLFFTGKLDDFLIYNRAITSTEAGTIFTSPDGISSNSPVCNGGTLNLTSPTIAGTPTYAWTGPNSYSAANTQNPSISSMSSVKEGIYTLTASKVGCATTTVVYTTVAINYDLGPAISQVPATGLQSFYKLDGNARDVQIANPGILQGSPSTTTDRYGIANKAYALNGSSQYISTTTQYTNPANFSISLWFKTASNTGGVLSTFGINKIGVSTQHDRVLYMTNTGQLIFGVYSGTTDLITSLLAYNDDSWHHVVASLSSTTGTKMYVDGSLVASNAGYLTGENYAGYWKFGYDSDMLGWPSAPGSAYFNGSIDDIIVYTTAISAANVTTLYSSPGGAGNNGPICPNGTLNLTAATVGSTTYSWSGPNSFSSSSQNPSVSTMSSAKEGTYTLTATSAGCIATAYTIGKINENLGPNISQIPAGTLLSYYKFNGNAADATGVNTGILQNAPTATQGRFTIPSAAYSFNGTTQAIATSVPYTNPTNLTISVWFNTLTGAGGKLIGLGNSQLGTSTTHDRHIYMINSGQIYFGVNPLAGKTTINSTYAYNDGNWHLATASVSATNGIKLYMDGVLVASNPAITSGQNFTGYWKIGFDQLFSWPNAPTSNYFNGKIDDVLIFNSELTAAQVLTLYTGPGGAGSNSPVCSGNTINLTAPTIGGATYAWTSVSTGFSSSSQNPTLAASAPKAGPYTLDVTVTATGCRSTAYATVAVTTPVSITTQPINKLTCVGTSVSNSVAATGNFNTYQWRKAGVNVGTATSGTYTIASPVSGDAGNYDVVVNSEGCSLTSNTIALTVITAVANQTTWSGTTSTDWATATNWACGGVPTSTIDATIPTGLPAYPVIAATANTRNITLASGTTLAITGSNALNVYGNWSNAGTFTPATSTVTFTGATGTAISGASTSNFYNIKQDKTSAATLTINAPVTLTEKLSFGTSAVNTIAIGTGNFTFLSTAGSTAHIDILTAPLPVFTGGFTCQKYLAAQTGRYNYMLATPVTTTASDLQPTAFDGALKPTDGIYLTGPFTGTSTGNGINSKSFTAFTYNPTSGLYVGYPVTGGNVTASMPIGTGYRVSIRDNGTATTTVPKTITLKGTLAPAGSYAFSGLVNGSNTRPFATAALPTSATVGGWNLIGNPYMSEISLDLRPATNIWTISNVSTTVYIYNASAKNYNSCAAGVGTCTVGAFQSFFVQATGASPALTITETAKITTSNITLLKRVEQSSLLNYLAVKLTSPQTETVGTTYIRYVRGANDNADQFDGFELGATNRNSLADLGLYTKSTDGNFYNVNAKEYNFVSDTTDLHVKLPAGNATLDFSSIENLESGYTISLYDKLTKKLVNVSSHPMYKFTATADSNSTGPRFQVIFNRAGVVTNTVDNNLNSLKGGAIVDIYPNPSAASNVKLLIENYSGNMDIEVFDLLGHLVYATQTKVDNKLDMTLALPSNLAPGVYTVDIDGDNNFSHTEKLIIK